MSFIGRFRTAAAGVVRAAAPGGRYRPGVELVRVERPALPPVPAPRLLRARPAASQPRRASMGTAALYGKVIDPHADPHGTGYANGRPRPLGRGPAHDKALYRDQVNPWRYGTPDPPPPTRDWAELREEFHAPRVPWWEQERRDS